MLCIDVCCVVVQVTFMGGRRGGSSAAPRDLNWAKLGEKAEHLFSTPPHLTFL